MEEYISAAEAAEQWGVSLRQVQRLIAAGRVAGAKKLGHSWILPKGSAKPQDYRIEKKQPPACPLPYGVPNFLLSPFYAAPGTLDLLPDTLESAEARTLCGTLACYYRGQSGEAQCIAESLQGTPCAFETQVGCTLLIATCALYSGSLRDWNRARARLLSLRRKRPDSRALTITEAALPSVLYVREAPDWLRFGRFSLFPPSSFPVLCYLYAKWLFMEKRYEGLLAAIEPMLAFTEQTGALAEYRRQLGTPLDDALKRRDPAAFIAVRDAYDRLAAGFTKLHNAVTGDTLSNELSLREYEIAALALRGESNAQIARRLSITVGSVKGYFNTLYQKLGVRRRDELGKYIL